MTNEEMAQVLEAMPGDISEYGPWEWFSSKQEESLKAGAAALRREQWRDWPKDNDEGGEYPPDSETVLIFCGNWANKPMQLGGINKRCGTYGPSGASHWMPLPAPPEGV